MAEATVVELTQELGGELVPPLHVRMRPSRCTLTGSHLGGGFRPLPGSLRFISRSGLTGPPRLSFVVGRRVCPRTWSV
eukprot:2388260-Prymnesium_polylepis.1